MARIIPITAAAPAAAGSLEFRVSPPLALYVHVPWCVRKCPYCDFNSHEAREAVPEEAYRAALIADLESALPLVWGRPVVSIFFGGGTPSLLSPDTLDRLLADLRMRLPLQGNVEVTLEANPGTVEAGRLAGFRAAGINRISLGIQSFDDTCLKALGRIHTAAEAKQAVEAAALHFDTFNLDLMYGLPGQSPRGALVDLETALSFAPPHLSCYQLTLEPNTAFAARPPADLPHGDTSADMQEAIEARLAAAGYDHYETSAFAQTRHHCRHNLNYWHFGDYLGIGAGAHSKLTLHDRVLRQMRWKHPEAYLEKVSAGQSVQEETAIATDQLPIEFLMNALRLAQGFTVSQYEARTGTPFAPLVSQVRRLTEEGLLSVEADRIAPTPRGRRFLNVLLEKFLPDA